MEQIGAVTDGQALLEIQSKVRKIGVERTVDQYIVELLTATRNDTRVRLGASPRESLMLFRAAQARAFMNQRDFVVLDDVKKLASPVLGHRIVLDSKARYGGHEKAVIIEDIVSSVTVPV